MATRTAPHRGRIRPVIVVETATRQSPNAKVFMMNATSDSAGNQNLPLMGVG